MDKNYVDIVGNCTRDAELKYTPGGMAVCNLAIACNESKKKPDGTWENVPSFFDVTCFAKLAERVAPVALKGKRFDISGHLKQERWTDKDGGNRSKVVIIADDIAPASILGSSSGATGGTVRDDSTPPDFPEDVNF